MIHSPALENLAKLTQSTHWQVQKKFAGLVSEKGKLSSRKVVERGSDVREVH